MEFSLLKISLSSVDLTLDISLFFVWLLETILRERQELARSTTTKILSDWIRIKSLGRSSRWRRNVDNRKCFMAILYCKSFPGNVQTSSLLFYCTFWFIELWPRSNSRSDPSVSIWIIDWDRPKWYKAIRQRSHIPVQYCKQQLGFLTTRHFGLGTFLFPLNPLRFHRLIRFVRDSITVRKANYTFAVVGPYIIRYCSSRECTTQKIDLFVIDRWVFYLYFATKLFYQKSISHPI